MQRKDHKIKKKIRPLSISKQKSFVYILSKESSNRWGLLSKFSVKVLVKIWLNLAIIDYKLIGVQTNHGVEYFGGPAAPTHQFLYNQWFTYNPHVL